MRARFVRFSVALAVGRSRSEYHHDDRGGLHAVEPGVGALAARRRPEAVHRGWGSQRQKSPSLGEPRAGCPSRVSERTSEEVLLNGLVPEPANHATLRYYLAKLHVMIVA